MRLSALDNWMIAYVDPEQSRPPTMWVSELTFCQDFNVELTYIFLLIHPRIGSAMHVQRREEDDGHGSDIILCNYFLK